MADEVLKLHGPAAQISFPSGIWAVPGCLEIALRVVGGVGDFNCSVDDPEHDKQRAEKQNTSDES